MTLRFELDATVYYALMTAGGAACAVGFAFSVKREPRRMSCALLLFFGLYLTVKGVSMLAWPDVPSPDGSLETGRGGELLEALRYGFMILGFASGVALCVNGARLIRREGMSLAHLLPLAFGAAGIAFPFLFFAPFILDFPLEAMLFTYRLIWPVAMYPVMMLASVLLYSMVYALLPKGGGAGFIVILGAGLRAGKDVTPLLAQRLDKGLQIWRKGGGRAKFVVCGGRGPDESVSEAWAMRAYLESKGVSAGSVILEDRSTTTAENLRFAKELIDRHGGGERAVIVTSSYHVLRAVMISLNEGLTAYGAGSHTAFYFLPGAFLREYLALCYEQRSAALGWIALALVNWLVHR